ATLPATDPCHAWLPKPPPCPAARAALQPSATPRHGPLPSVQASDSAGPGPARRLRLRGEGLPDPVRRGQSHHRLALQRLSLLPPHRSRLMSTSANGTSAAQLVRCAVYTRKSTHEGLEQAFNSLDAQRQAAEAYIQSQASEGWCCLPQRYDDGGYSGGTLDRPALTRLLADCAAGQIDCVVAYKVDRLSRSLLDFAKMMDAFDQQHVSFVSVTQQFNTATTMAPLVLNVLLSLPHFEPHPT